MVITLIICGTVVLCVLILGACAVAFSQNIGRTMERTVNAALEADAQQPMNGAPRTTLRREGGITRRMPQ